MVIGVTARWSVDVVGVGKLRRMRLTAPSSVASCDKYLREMMKRQQKHSVWKRMLDRVMRKLTGDDG